MVTCATWARSMPQRQRLRADHAPTVLAFEIANRTYFAASISDRGEEYFEHFTERLDVLVAEQRPATVRTTSSWTATG